LENNQKLQRRKSRRKGIFGLFTLAILVGGSLFGVKIAVKNRDLRDVGPYTVSAEVGTLPGVVIASGELQAIRSVNVSPEKQGLLEELYVSEGDQVKKGALIGKMVGGDYLYRLNEVKAEFEKQNASYERRKELFGQGAISAEKHEEYRNRFWTSEARLRQLEVEGKELLIRAPFAGVITNRYAEPGAFVAPTTRASSIQGSTSSTVVELSQGLEVAAKVPESDIGRIQAGQKALVRVDSFPDKRFKVEVSEIAPRASKDDNVTSFEVTLSFLERPKTLRIGMTADVEFQTGQSDPSVLVPTVAIVTENGKPGVLVVGKNKQPLFQKVELGSSSGSKTAIIEGIDQGEPIFIDLPPWAKEKNN